MPLEFSYAVEPDEHGIIDGRELARQMIGNAYRLIVPYVAACPACADNLFTAIANQCIEAMHEDARAKGEKLAGFFYSVRPPGTERDQGEKDHLAAAEDETVRLLRQATGEEPHRHERARQ